MLLPAKQGGQGDKVLFWSCAVSAARPCGDVPQMAGGLQGEAGLSWQLGGQRLFPEGWGRAEGGDRWQGSRSNLQRPSCPFPR